MIEIDDKIVSADLLHECFACDLAACKGACCVEGNAGAPLEADEVDVLEDRGGTKWVCEKLFDLLSKPFRWRRT